MAAEGMLSFSVVSVVEDVLRQQGSRLGDYELASKKSDEESSRRYEAAEWLRKIVGVVYSKDLPAEPSEQDFRLGLRSGIILCTAINKVKPGSIPKLPTDNDIGHSLSLVVDAPNHTVIIPDGVGLMASQYFENVRNFLNAAEEIGLPTFEASDLEQGGETTKVVDSVLALKSYYDWKSNSRSLNLMIRALLKDKKPDEIPIIVECMLSRVMEEIDTRIARQNYTEVKTTPETMSVSGQNISPSDSPKAETQNISPTDSSKAEPQQNIFARDSPMEEIQRLSARDPPKEETQQNISSRDTLKEERQNNEEETTIDKHREKQQVHEKVRTQQDVLLETKENILKKCKLLLAQQDSNFQELKGTVHATKETVQLLQMKYQEEFSHLGEHLQTLTHAAAQYKKVLEENRKLYNQVQDLKGNIRVYCRVRPFLPGQENRFTTVEHVEDRTITISTPSKHSKEGKKSFSFNKVFGPSATQAEVFADMQPLVRSVLDGYNVCIFAYGQTGAGKTFTMSGPNNPTEETYGVNYRALNDLFYLSEERKATISYEVSVQMMEIYNEQVRDLLATDDIRNSSQNGINVPDANRLPVTTTADVIHLMNLGFKNRAVCSTAMNDRSSRSHSCMTVHVQGKDLTSGATLRGCMHLVDLAGSERVDKSEVTGDRLKEAVHINKSLSALGDVIASLATKNTHVPYRNSKLTQLLQDSLGGQAKTLMFVHISPEADAVGETISTLKFAERVASVELGAARANKDSSDVKELKDQISSLKAALTKKDEEMEQYVRSLTGTPESMSVESSPMHPALSVKSNSTASSPIHPSLSAKSNGAVSSSTASRAPKDNSGTRTSPEKGAGSTKNDQSSNSQARTDSPQQQSRRRSLDPTDILANEAHWPPLSVVKTAVTSGDTTPKKESLQRHGSLGTFEKPQPQKPFSSLVASAGASSNDSMDELSVATCDSSEADSPLRHQNHLSRVSSLPNILGSKIKRPQAKAPSKNPEVNKYVLPVVCCHSSCFFVSYNTWPA
ncbi:hypothetical protein Cgig2_018058 [Carnegiea gigantea]|uniref:Kinesin heavy chain n=1 Tax=Carnegiea gigantea TaxID=171969 RepID=A0A9Q1JNQ3_9CARY|nr:hypothetical protein Cgig2_018058 [Carnegiea gigantea]